MRIILHSIQKFQSLRWFLSSDRVRGWTVSLFFGSAVVAVFYALEKAVPAESEYYSQTVTLLFILISVLILFPARDRALRLLLRRSDYDRIFGSEQHHLDFMAQHFTIPVMTEDVFPALMSWLRVRSGRIAVMDNSAKNVIFYIVKQNRMTVRNSGLYEYHDILHSFLKQHRGIIRNHDNELPEPVRLFMARFNAVIMVPFIYRKTPVGFMILHQPPDHQYAERALDMFARKAAVTIHNAHLSEKMADLALYDREMRSAVKVQKFLHKSPVPDLKNLRFRTAVTGYELTSTEFFRTEHNRHIMVITAFPRISGIGGLVLAGIIGRLYSFIHSSDTNRGLSTVSEQDLVYFLKNDEDPVYTGHRAEFLIWSFEERGKEIRMITEGNFFLNAGDRQLAGPGSRITLKPEPGLTMELRYKKSPLLYAVYNGKAAR